MTIYLYSHSFHKANEPIRAVEGNQWTAKNHRKVFSNSKTMSMKYLGQVQGPLDLKQGIQ